MEETWGCCSPSLAPTGSIRRMTRPSPPRDRCQGGAAEGQDLPAHPASPSGVGRRARQGDLPSVCLRCRPGLAPCPALNERHRRSRHSCLHRSLYPSVQRRPTDLVTHVSGRTQLRAGLVCPLPHESPSGLTRPPRVRDSGLELPVNPLEDGHTDPQPLRGQGPGGHTHEGGGSPGQAQRGVVGGEG